MIILAVDSGLEKTGYAIFNLSNDITNHIDYITSGLIKTEKEALEIRLNKIYISIENLVKKYKPNLLVIEQIFFFKNKKTVISVSQAQGVIILLAARFNIQLKFITPLQIKQSITGYGAADKKSVQKMITLSLSRKIKILNDDQSDAIACGLAYCYLFRNTIK